MLPMNTPLSPPISAVIAPGNRKMLVSGVVEETSDRIPFDVHELIRTPLSDKLWRMLRVPADQIEPVDSDWDQIRSAPGIYVAGSSNGIYRVAVDQSYVPWLNSNMFTFQYVNPMRPVDKEAPVQGQPTTTWNADSRFVEDALKVIFSGCSAGLELYYRNFALERQKVPIEWAILRRDLESDTQIRTKFFQALVLMILGFCGDYDKPPVLALLRKNESGLLRSFRSLSCYPRNSSPTAAEFHKISLFRHLLEFVGGKRDCRQYNFIDPQYSAIDNANIYGSVVGIKGSKPFRICGSQKMLDILSNSPLFLAETIQTLDIVKFSAQLIVDLLVGFPNRCLEIPSEILSKLDCEQAGMIYAQIEHFYQEHPSLQIPTNDILVLLAWSSIRPTANRVLAEWAISGDGLLVYKRIVKDLQDSQSVGQLILTLAALLCYQRLLPFTPNDPNQPLKGSYQVDFDAILNGERLGNGRTVSEYMCAAILRVFYVVDDDEKMYSFLSSVLCTDFPVLDSFQKLSSQYWMYRMEDGLGHKEAFTIALLEYATEEIVGQVVTDEEEMDYPGDKGEVDIVDIEEEKKEGVAVVVFGETKEESWVIV